MSSVGGEYKIYIHSDTDKKTFEILTIFVPDLAPSPLQSAVKELLSIATALLTDVVLSFRFSDVMILPCFFLFFCFFLHLVSCCNVILRHFII